MSVSPSGNSATLGAGVKGKEVVEFLWPLKKQTTTGVCECVGLLGVALGGGHGTLQGYYGLLSDQILSARVVLANGTAITVSEAERAELFWALQGAGHNFGIVTSLDYRIYDIDYENGKDIWSYEVFAYPATKENVRAVYTAAKASMETQPEGIFQYGLVLTNPIVSPDPIILQHIVWNGPISTIRTHTQAYHALGPFSIDKEEGTYLDTPRYLQVDAEGMVCNANSIMPGAGIPRFPVDLEEYNIDALVAAVEKFKEITTSVKEFSASFFLLEQYPQQAVRRVDPETSAFPTRKDRLLL